MSATEATCRAERFVGQFDAIGSLPACGRRAKGERVMLEWGRSGGAVAVVGPACGTHLRANYTPRYVPEDEAGTLDGKQPARESHVIGVMPGGMEVELVVDEGPDRTELVHARCGTDHGRLDPCPADKVAP